MVSTHARMHTCDISTQMELNFMSAHVWINKNLQAHSIVYNLKTVAQALNTVIKRFL